ncbi:MAG: sulfotransferase [Bacteroidota bacterium]
MSQFFISGVQRSGTTMLSVMLEKHPDVLMEKRSIAFRIISCFKSLYDVLPYNLSIDSKELLRWLVDNDSKGRLATVIQSDLLQPSGSVNIRQLIQSSIDQKLAQEGCLLWGDKSPNIEYFANDIMLLMPKAKFLHIVRDGRAVAYSMSTRSSRNLLLSAQKWADGNVCSLVNQQILGPDRFKIIRYEDLLTQPEKVMRSVCDFLELPFVPEMLQLTDPSLEGDKSYVKNYFDRSKIDKWRDQLSERSLRKIEQIQGPLLEQLGYERSPFGDLPHRPLSVWQRIRYNQADNIRQLFRSRRMGMVDRKNVEIHIPLKNRLYIFAKVFTQDVFSVPIFKHLFPRVYYRARHYQPSNHLQTQREHEFD